jgi:hypothetical protein
VLEAAQTLRSISRSRFFECVAAALADKPNPPGDGDVGRAIKAALAVMREARLVVL